MRSSAYIIEQGQVMYRHTPSLYFGSPLFAVVVALLLINSVNHVQLSLWLGFVFLLAVYRFFIYKKSEDHLATPEQCFSYLETIAYTSLLSGVQWAICVLLFFDVDYIFLAVFLGLGVFNMSAMSLATLSAYPKAFVMFSVPSVSAIAFCFYDTGIYEFEIIGALTILFLLGLIRLCRMIHQFLLDSITLRIEKEALIEALKVERDAVTQVNHDKSRFFAAASHDLRQPLQAISLFSSTLLSRLEKKENKRIVNNIVASSDNLTDLLNSLLEISRLEAHVVEKRASDFSLSCLIGDVIREHLKLASENEVSLDAQFSGAVWAASDPLVVKRLLQNILSNAIQHAGKNITVTLSVRREGEHLCVSVIDNGSGIPQAEIEHIFKDFYQLNNPERDKHKGFGLGLGIVKRLADIINTDVHVESTLGKGTIFSFYLPVGQEPRNHKAEHSPVAKLGLEANFYGAGILLVEDREEVRDAFTAMLNSWNCRVYACEGVTPALLASIDEVDLVISDFRLKNHVTGLEEVERVNAYFGIEIPVIIVTGETSTECLEQLDASGYALLQKPVSAPQLRMAIESALLAELDGASDDAEPYQ